MREKDSHTIKHRARLHDRQETHACRGSWRGRAEEPRVVVGTDVSFSQHLREDRREEKGKLFRSTSWVLIGTAKMLYDLCSRILTRDTE